MSNKVALNYSNVNIIIYIFIFWDNMHLKKLLFFTLLFSFSLNSKDLLNKKVKIHFDDLSGTIPYKYYCILNELKNLQEDENSFLINRLILHGPPGNGKTVYAKKLADEIGAVFINVSSPLLINHMQGSGAENVNIAFEAAFSEHQKTERKVVVFFDEATALSGSGKEKRLDSDLANQSLCLNLDKIKNDSNYYVILATNDISNFYPALLDRFGDNIIEFSLPNYEMRKEVIEFYSEKFELKLEDNFVCYLAKYTDKFSIRSIEDILKSFKRVYFVENGQITYSLIDSILDIFKYKNKTNNKPETLYNKFGMYLQNLNLGLNIIPSLGQTIMFTYFAYNFLFGKKEQVNTSNSQPNIQSGLTNDLMGRGTVKYS